MYDFGAGPVAAHQHSNGGGWVADTATVSTDSYVGPLAVVFDTARVTDASRVEDTGSVSGSAWVTASTVSGRARVGDSAIVSRSGVGGRARITDHARIYGVPYCNRWVGGRAVVRY